MSLISGILTISSREMKRFRSKISGKALALLLIILGLSIVLSYLVSQQGFFLSKDIYTVGISPDTPIISGQRFKVLTFGHDDGMALLDDKVLDVYLEGDMIYHRNDARSLYAIDAIKQYVESGELKRIAREYGIDKAFPVRVSINWLNATGTNNGPGIFNPVAVPSILPEPSSAVIPSPTLRPTLTIEPQAPTPLPEPDDTRVIDSIDNRDGSPLLNFDTIRENDVLIPSLMNPPLPLAEVMLSFIYILPVFFISIFFTGSIMEEKTNKRISILLSSPVSPFQIIIGKLLPYLLFSILLIIITTLAMKGDLFISMAIMLPVTLFIFSIYLFIALIYRTFKDQTFFSMAVIACITCYFMFPALFTGMSEISYISPLTLIVEMYKGDPFKFKEYIFSIVPMFAFFLVTMFVSVKILNEEYQIAYSPLHIRIADAIFLSLNKKRVYLSIGMFSLFIVPVLYMAQLVIIALSFNLPEAVMLNVIIIFSVILEEIGKSAGIAVLLERKVVKSFKNVIILSFISAAGFLIGEKILLFFSLSIISNVLFTEALGSLELLVLPLLAHFIFTLLACSLVRILGSKWYPFAIILSSIAHYAYNFYLLGMFG